MLADLRERYQEVRHATEALCRGLTTEDMVVQTMPDASPVKWHLGHTTWFFEAFVLAHVTDYRPFHPQFAFLFNSYYETAGAHWPRPERGLLSRPSVDEVLAYRRHVDRLVRERWSALGAHLGTLELGLQHEQQHQELILSDVKYLLALQPLQPRYREAKPAATAPAASPSWRRYDGGLRELGHGGGGFAFDNERPRHRVYLAPFRLATRLVTVAEYLDFMNDRGYQRPELWLSDGWAAVQRERWQAPLYWRREGDGHVMFTLTGVREPRGDEPVCHVSYYEADAYARWARARLPSEAEWEIAAASAPLAGSFVESGYWHPQPSGIVSQAGDTRVSRPGDTGISAPSGMVSQLYGDCWQWTSSAYAPYPGFRPLAGTLGEYNGKFMCSQQVLRGASCATPRSHARASYRNFFPPAARWQFSGIRLASDDE